MTVTSRFRLQICSVVLLFSSAVVVFVLIGSLTPAAVPAPEQDSTFESITDAQAPSVSLASPRPDSFPPLPKIDSSTALDNLLPTAPLLAAGSVYTGDDLTRVPEIHFEAAPTGAMTTELWRRRKAHTAAAALHLNARDEDGFLAAMLKRRADLAGLPFAMGDACRSKRPRAVTFKHASEQLERHKAKFADESTEKIEAHTAVVRQRFMAGDGDSSHSALLHLLLIPHPEATRGLARIAVFSPEKMVRQEALKALSVRRESDYTSVFLEALNYPWPDVARNTAEAIVKLGRRDLMPQLVDMLDGTDPRVPKTEVVNGKKTTTARELVRIHHHMNCMLCHAPADRERVPTEILVAEVPIPTEPLTKPSQGYGNTGSNLLVRIDVTYLRQDFSVMQAVDEKGPWPAKQRFDFIVRKRPLSSAEADELRDRLKKLEPGVLSPYQKAAVSALREMTGRDFEAKAEPWRRHLNSKEP